jgi:hypothetical protein
LIRFIGELFPAIAKIPETQRLPRSGTNIEDGISSLNITEHVTQVRFPNGALAIKRSTSKVVVRFIMHCFFKEFVKRRDSLALFLESSQYSGNNHLLGAS